MVTSRLRSRIGAGPTSDAKRTRLSTLSAHVCPLLHDPGNTGILYAQRQCSAQPTLPLCPIITGSPSSPPLPIILSNYRISPPCLILNLRPPPRPLTSSSSSIMPLTNTRLARGTTYLPIRSPPSSNPAILPVQFSPSFSSNSRGKISSEAVMIGGQDGLIRPLTFSTPFLPQSERALVWYASGFNLFEMCMLILIWQVFSPVTVISTGIGLLLSVCILDHFVWAIVTPTSHRQLRMFEQARTPSSTSLSALRCISNVSRFIQRSRRPRR